MNEFYKNMQCSEKYYSQKQEEFRRANKCLKVPALTVWSVMLITNYSFDSQYRTIMCWSIRSIILRISS